MPYQKGEKVSQLQQLSLIEEQRNRAKLPARFKRHPDGSVSLSFTDLKTGGNMKVQIAKNGSNFELDTQFDGSSFNALKRFMAALLAQKCEDGLDLLKSVKKAYSEMRSYEKLVLRSNYL